jgi:hypothetical protein
MICVSGGDAHPVRLAKDTIENATDALSLGSRLRVHGITERHFPGLSPSHRKRSVAPVSMTNIIVIR